MRFSFPTVTTSFQVAPRSCLQRGFTPRQLSSLLRGRDLLRHCKPRPLHPERSRVLGRGQVQLLQRQHFCTAQLSPRLGCRAELASGGQAERLVSDTPHGQALLCLPASSHWHQSPPVSPTTVPCVFPGSALILSLQHPSACRGITLSAWGRGQTHNSPERKAAVEGCCPPSSLPTSAEADGARAHHGQEGCARPAALWGPAQRQALQRKQGHRHQPQKPGSAPNH